MDDHDLIKLALLIAQVGGFKDYLASETGRGFKLREHDADRDKPFSPFYFDLRAQESPEPGPLTPDIVLLAGKKLAELVQHQELLKRHAYVAGLPSAGDSFSSAMLSALPSTANVTSLKIIKHPIGGVGKEYRFKLAGEPPPSGTHVLLVDDLASTNGRKLRAAAMLREHGLIVTDYVVLVDRRRTSVRSNDIGLTCHSVCTIEKLVAIYREHNVFRKPEIADVILRYAYS